MERPAARAAGACSGNTTNVTSRSASVSSIDSGGLNLSTTARQRHCLSHEGSGNTRQRQCLSYEGSENIMHRHCLGHESSGNARQRHCLGHEDSGNTRQRQCLGHESSGTTRQRQCSNLLSESSSGRPNAFACATSWAAITTTCLPSEVSPSPKSSGIKYLHSRVHSPNPSGLCEGRRALRRRHRRSGATRTSGK